MKPYKLDREKVGSQFMFKDEDEGEEDAASKAPGDQPQEGLDIFEDEAKGFTDNWQEIENKAMEDYRLDKTSDKNALKDFVIKPYKEYYKANFDPKQYEYPINYYDNDDGFWDSFIAHKKSGYDSNEMITKRFSFKH